MKRLAFISVLAMAPAQLAAEEILFRCWFDWVCDPNTKCDHAGEDIRFRVDSATNAVSRIGGNELSKFALILGDRALTVLETPVSGGTTTTTILIDGGSAVHSENTVSGRDLSPRQYLGECIAS